MGIAILLGIVAVIWHFSLPEGKTGNVHKDQLNEIKKLREELKNKEDKK